jgi:hypothetical protein
MPLKHCTETLLIVCLAAVMIVAGIALSTLPDLPAGAPAWAVLMALALAYPIALYPALRRNRADYEFRALHFLPALFVLLWLVIQITSQKIPDARSLSSALTWGYTGIPVSIFFFLLILFVLQVIRRRVPRLTFLLLLFVPYAAAAVLSEQAPSWNTQLASALWGWTGSGTSSMGQIAQNTQRSLPKSADPDEEEWRQKLRDRDAADRASSSALSSSSVIALGAKSSSSTPLIAMKPTNGTLPSAGPGMELLGSIVVAAYCGVLHQRAKRRV